MAAKSKLYHRTARTFELPSYVDRTHKVLTVSAQDIPLLEWPDGRWCLPANVYMLELYHRGLSRRNRGGTLFTYATNISHLLRYCYDNQVDVIDLTDNQFTLFVKMLQGERRSGDPNLHVRDANSVIAVGRNCLDFLSSVGRLYQDCTVIGPNGRIRAQEKVFEIRLSGGRRGKGRIRRTYWHHRAFPTPDPKNRRLPISTEVVRKLREAVLPLGGSIFVRRRRYAMLTLLEITGARRSEVAAMTVESVYQASRMEHPMLNVLTIKRKGGADEYRLIPIARHNIVHLIEFIEVHRRRIVRTTCGLDRDDGYLLLSETTGRNLRANMLNQEIGKLKKQAGITGKVCPHMFRHQFITKLFIALIEQHQVTNEDEFRRAMLDTETMKQKIQQWTGHKDLSSLDVYINLAFEEVTDFKKTYNMVSAMQILDSFKTSLEQVQQELRSGTSPSLTTDQLMKMVGALQDDLERLRDLSGAESKTV
jgi:site-specific recombinase XerD